MKRIFMAVLLLSAFQIAHATLIHYSLGGQMSLADTNFNNIHTASIFGDMYISDIQSITGTPGNQDGYWDIVSFAVNAENIGWGGSGYIWTPLYGSLETQIHISSPAGTDYVTGHPDFYNVGFTDPTILPDQMSWPGFGWYFGSQYFAQINSLIMTRVPTSVPEPPSILLLYIGLFSLVFLYRKRKGIHQ